MNVSITGQIHYVVKDSNGNIKMEGDNHNVVVNLGDAYICDMLNTNSSRAKMTGSKCWIHLGSGWTGVNTKANKTVNTYISSGTKLVDTNYPLVENAPLFDGGLNNNVLTYKWTGLTSVTGTVNEVLIASYSGATSPTLTGNMNTTATLDAVLAYAQVSPAVVLTSSDTLDISWSITFSGT